MDVARNRYFALAPRSDQAFRSLAKFRVDPAQPSISEELKETGLLEFVCSTAALSPELPDPRTDLQEVRATTTAGQFLSVVFTLILAKLVLKLVPFGRIVSYLENLRENRATQKTSRLSYATISAAFHQSEILLKREDDCLARSIAFFWLCKRRGSQTKLVIGVRVHPFAAHSWVQDGDMILNDSKDNVRLYRPSWVI